jgi:hypothetical protein
MQLPSLDFSPLRMSGDLATTANRASLIPKQAALNDKLRGIQGTANVLNSISSAVSTGAQIFGILEQAQTEKAKSTVAQMGRDLELKAQADNFNGNYTKTTDENGNISYGMSDEYNNLRADYESKLATQFEGYTRVTDYARGLLSAQDSQVQTWAVGQKYNQATKDRDDTALANVGEAVKAAVARRDLSPIRDQFMQMTWLSPDRQEAGIAAAEGQAKYEIKRGYVLDAATAGYDVGLETLDNVSEGLSIDQVKQIKTDLAAREDELTAATTTAALSAFSERIAAGESPSIAAKTIKDTLGTTARGQAAYAKVEAVFKEKATDPVIDKYNEVRTSYDDLGTLYKEVESGRYASYFDGIPETQKAMLDMISNEMARFPSAKEPKPGPDPIVESTMRTFGNNMAILATAHEVVLEDPVTGTPVRVRADTQEEYNAIVNRFLFSDVIGADGKPHALIGMTEGLKVKDYYGLYQAGPKDEALAAIQIQAKEFVAPTIGGVEKVDYSKGLYSQKQINTAIWALSDWRKGPGKDASKEEMDAQFKNLLIRPVVTAALSLGGTGPSDQGGLDTAEVWTQALQGGVLKIFASDPKRYQTYLESMGVDTKAGVPQTLKALTGSFLEKAKTDLSAGDVSTSVDRNTGRLLFSIPRQGGKHATSQSEIFTPYVFSKAEAAQHPDWKITPNQEWWMKQVGDTWIPWTPVGTKR